MDKAPDDAVLLDRCPFCGGEAEVSEGTQGGSEPRPWFYIECTSCAASANSVADWNARCAPSQAGAIPEGMVLKEVERILAADPWLSRLTAKDSPLGIMV